MLFTANMLNALNVGHFQRDPFKVPPKSKQKASLTAIFLYGDLWHVWTESHLLRSSLKQLFHHQIPIWQLSSCLDILSPFWKQPLLELTTWLMISPFSNLQLGCQTLGLLILANCLPEPDCQHFLPSITFCNTIATPLVCYVIYGWPPTLLWCQKNGKTLILDMLLVRKLPKKLTS